MNRTKFGEAVGKFKDFREGVKSMWTLVYNEEKIKFVRVIFKRTEWRLSLGRALEAEAKIMSVIRSLHGT